MILRRWRRGCSLVVAGMLAVITPVWAATSVGGPPAKVIVIHVQADSSVPQDLLDRYVFAQQVQINRDFFRVWGIYAQVSEVDAPGAWQVYIGTTGIGRMALCGVCYGYHWVENNVPVAYAYTDRADDADPWPATASHEVLEMLVDPMLGQGDACCHVRHIDTGAGAVNLEVADPVQDNYYQVEGVWMSDFVFPSFFDAHAKGPYDQLGILQFPYREWQGEAGNGEGPWTQVGMP